jgi:hypothetical protein
MTILRIARVMLLTTWCMLLAGCVSKSANGTAITFRYHLSIPIGILIAGVACVPIGLALRKRNNLMAWAFMLIGPLGALLFGPSMLFHRFTVDDAGFREHFMVAEDIEIPFDALKAIRIGTEVTRGRYSRVIGVLHFDYKKGFTGDFPLNPVIFL